MHRVVVSQLALLSLMSMVGCTGATGETTDSNSDALAADWQQGPSGHHDETAIVEWDEETLRAIEASGYGATIAARAIAEVHTAMYDAWTAYSNGATPTQPSVTPQPPHARTDENKTIATSYAAYRTLVDLFPAQTASFDKRLHSFGGKPSDTSTTGSDPASIGNAAAAAVIAFRHEDASNQLGDITPGPYSDYTGYAPVNTPTTMNDPNRWQPLVVEGQTQSFLTPQWEFVIPFALTDATAFRPTPPVQFGAKGYNAQAEALIDLSAQLDDRTKALAEYWTDGPGTSTAPGHWMQLAQFVSQRDHHSIDDDAKLFFALGSAMLDTSISVWDAKRFYDYVRPITAVHVVFGGHKVKAWAGPYKGTRLIDGAKWLPYEPADEVTPNDAEYAAEESAFAFAAAEVLRSFTGSDAFGASFEAKRGSSRIEPGLTPRHDERFCWSTYTHAAESAGYAGQLRGVHFAASDDAGRTMGKDVGALTWKTALALFHTAGAKHVHAGVDCRDGVERGW